MVRFGSLLLVVSCLAEVPGPVYKRFKKKAVDTLPCLAMPCRLSFNPVPDTIILTATTVLPQLLSMCIYKKLRRGTHRCDA